MSNKPDIKIIFVDIDWTIFDHDIHDWDYESIDVIKKIQNSGILIFLCTARPYDSILRMGLFDVLNMGCYLFYSKIRMFFQKNHEGIYYFEKHFYIL